VRADAPGLPVTDYHTVQTAKYRRNFAPEKRRDILAGSDLVTTITKREYLTDIRFTAAVALKGEDFTHEILCEALHWPHFPLYLGRKSCPPALPLDPWTTEITDVHDAFSSYDIATSGRAAQYWPLAPEAAQISAEADLFTSQERPPHRLERRRVKPLDRKTWQFALLDELVLLDRPAHEDLA
jgi:CRISPR system Cascade subunit CasD